MIVLLFSACVMAQPPDLAKLERAIAKEPAYKNRPLYGLVALGPQADFRAWFVLDGVTLYVDANGDGDLTDPAEKFAAKKSGDSLLFPNVPLAAQGQRRGALRLIAGKLKELAHVYGDDLTFKAMLALDPDKPHYSLAIEADETMPGRAKETRYLVSASDLNELFQLGPSPATAPLVHAGGPWRMATWDSRPSLEIGGVTDFIVGVGCPGVGPGTFAFLGYEEAAMPEQAIPKLTLHLPARADGTPPIVVHHYLKERC